MTFSRKAGGEQRTKRSVSEVAPLGAVPGVTCAASAFKSQAFLLQARSQTSAAAQLSKVIGDVCAVLLARCGRIDVV